MKLPPLPVPVGQFLKYTKGCTDHSELSELVKPFKTYESKLREIYAQHPDHPAVKENHLVPIFSDNGPLPVIRARNLESEPCEVKDQYLLPLDEEDRRPNGSPATVKTLSEFQNNFNLFSECSLVDLDWNNVIAAGSSVVTALLPVDAPHNESKRALRTYYHQTLAPASDVDLFLYGLDEEQAIEKIKQIESKIRDSILSETTTIRTKNAITIVSEYPTRHVQIVLRLYKSKSEILTGFDVDCACLAYDGEQVWASPRALTAFMTQVNTIDLTRRSPSYENRLSKYSHRGFEVYWPVLDRSRIDPTIFERSFGRVKGLARLLVLEKLPHPADREAYLERRRRERGRPGLPWNAHFRRQLAGNVKEEQPEDVAEWVEEDEVSNYHTFTIPYGPKYTARKIEKLLFTKDLLLNAEWNRPKDRQTKLHRHPAFFGYVEDVIDDCCGCCPKPESDEDLKAFEEESAKYISGNLTFLKDDPGRQEIGSFHPISDEDWTEMAYVGNTTRLCQAIVDKDLEAVEDWFSSGDPEEVLDVNRRDHVGRTPLLLATMSSTPEIVQFLIERGARLVSRLYNGMTALHIAAYRGETEMVKMLLSKSESNEEDQARKEDAKKAARRAAVDQAAETSQVKSTMMLEADNDDSSSEFGDDDDDDDEDDDDDDDDDSSDKMTEGSFVKVSEPSTTDMLEENLDEPDVYDINVLAWDQPMSPLHLAIIAGKVEVVKLLVEEFGADVLLPVKILSEYNREPEAAILTLVLALELPLHKSRETVDTLLSLGAPPTQADMKEQSALRFAISQAKETIVSAMLSKIPPDRLAKALNHTNLDSNYLRRLAPVDTPLVTAIRTGDSKCVGKLLDLGAGHTISYESWKAALIRAAKGKRYELYWTRNTELTRFRESVQQPIIVALESELPAVVSLLIDAGADVNTLPPEAWGSLQGPRHDPLAKKSLLDLVREKIEVVETRSDKKPVYKKPEPLAADETYLDFPAGSYRLWTAKFDLFQAKIVKKTQMKTYENQLHRTKEAANKPGAQEKEAEKKMLEALKELESKILAKGGKTFSELHPDAGAPYDGKDQPGPRKDLSPADGSSYQTKFVFTFEDRQMDEEKDESYLSLFEAAFAGDLETVKNLCLNTENPLLVEARDAAGFSPFSLAVLRGHYHLASTILDIATVQYKPSDKNKPKYRYRLANAENFNDYDSQGGYGCGYESDDSESPGLIRELVEGKFTVEDITALGDKSKSEMSPQALLEHRAGVWRGFGGDAEAAMKEFELEEESPRYFMHNMPYIESRETSDEWLLRALIEERNRCNQSLVRYAMAKNDMEMLLFLLTAGRKLMARKENEDGTTNQQIYSISDDDFRFALRRGRTEMIGEIIKATGHGIPLNKMVARTGAKVEEQKGYYQGLTVHGRKRTDWAEQGRPGGGGGRETEEDTSPLLKAIFEGNLRSAEYYLSDGPLNRYLEFAKAHRHDKRIESLEAAEGGLHKTVGNWLSARPDLAAHMAVMANPAEKGNPLLEYVLKAIPNSLEAKSSQGLTPLHVAFRLGRVQSLKILLRAGADQGTRDDKGLNILHALVQHRPLYVSGLFSRVFQLLDKETVQSLLLQKGNAIYGEDCSMTPLAMALLNQPDPDKEEVRTILDYSGGKDLGIMNGTGDYIIHELVRQEDKPEFVKLIVDRRPEMLWWENATGLTAMEVAWLMRLQYIVSHPLKISRSSRSRSTYRRKVSSEDEKDLQSFMELGADELEWAKQRQCYTHHLLEKLAERFPGKRKLVSLFDANEVARRLAKEQLRKNDEEAGRVIGGWTYRRARFRTARRASDHLELDEVERWWQTAEDHPREEQMAWASSPVSDDRR